MNDPIVHIGGQHETPDHAVWDAESLLEAIRHSQERSAAGSSSTRDEIDAFFEKIGDPKLEAEDIEPGQADSPDKTDVLLSLDSPVPESSKLPSKPPVQVPSHILMRCLGMGGFGQVWIARHTLTEHYRACKLISPGKYLELDGLKRLKRRVRNHPNLMPIEEVGRVDDWLYVLMPLANNADSDAPVLDPSGYEPQTLELHLRRRGGRLPPCEVVQIGIQIVDAVAHLHRCGLTHGDIKPANILRVENRWMLADYSLIRSVSNPTGEGYTPGYIPPEGPGTTGADEFALGVVLMEMLTGWSARMLKDFKATPTEKFRLDQPGPRLIDIIHKATADDKKDRYRSLEAMRTMIEAAAQPRRRPHRYALFITVTLLALLVGGLWYGWQRRHSVPNAPPTAGAPYSLIESFVVDKYREDINHNKSYHVGTIGENTTAATVGDVVTIHAKFRAQAYAYLLSMDTNGVVKLRVPASDTEAPLPTMAVNYPNKSRSSVNMVYPLEDGPGVQGFLLVASEHPLPSYRDWNALHGQPHWPPAVNIDTALVFDGHVLRAVEGGNRGEPRPVIGNVRLDPVEWADTLPADVQTYALFFPVQPAE